MKKSDQKKYIVRWARREDFDAIGETAPFRIRAVAIDDGEKAVMVGGVGYYKNTRMAFMNGNKDVPAKMIIKAARFVKEHILSKSPVPVYAEPDPEIASAHRFIRYMGFVPFDGDVFILGEQ